MESNEVFLFRYSYLIFDAVFLTAWLLIFWRVKRMRRPMLVMSAIAALFGPVSEFWYFADYWQPELALPLPGIGGVEDLLFGFAIGGIAAFFYESLLGQRIRYRAERKEGRIWFLFVFAIVLAASMIFLNNALGINSIFASSLAFFAIAAVMLAMRPDITSDALGSALLAAGTMFAIYFFGQEFFPTWHLWMTRIWKLYGTPQGFIFFKHVPWTELLWGFSWGLVWGPMYEFLVGARMIRLKIFTH